MHHSLNEAQDIAVGIVDGPALVLAGAGSGKTRVVTARIVHLIQSGVPASSILGLTFTNKAAKEMKERVRRLMDVEVLISTFHSLGAKILRESISALGFPSNFLIYDEDDSEKLLKRCLERFQVKEKKGGIHHWRQLISRAKNGARSPDSIDKEGYPCDEPFFPQVYRAYIEGLFEAGAVDFDDLLYLPIRLFQEHPALLAHYQDRWRYLLIDEYQDTNEAQYALVTMLVAKTHNLFVVGDPDQAIYSWRGANIHNILNFERDYPGARVVRLERNYRSRANILEAANSLISNNQSRYKKTLWSALGDGEKIKRFTAYDERDEARFVVKKTLYHHQVQKLPLRDMVVFYRTNAQSRPLEDQLLAAQVPYTIVGGVSFYQRREVKDILSFLRVVQMPSDGIAFSRTIQLPKRGVGETTVEKLRAAALLQGMPLFDYCQALLEGHEGIRTISMNTRARQGLTQYVQIIKKMQLIAQEGSMRALVRATIEESGYKDYLKEDVDSAEERLSNVEELVAKAAEWDVAHEHADLSLFLEELSLKSTLDELDESHDRLNLMTIHNGKGLEFQVTFLVGLEEDLFPHVNSRGSDAALEEERRLCYVGMTRAKEVLYITDAQMRYLWGVQRTQRPSRFLKEIPAHLIEKEKK